MAKVNSPLFSQKASGTFGKILQFRCGRFVLLKPRKIKEEGTEGQNFQRELFKNGAKVWKNVLTPEQREKWENFAKSVRHEYGWFTISTPLGPIFVRIGEKTEWEKCIIRAHFNGYQYFQSCYLRFGPNGWDDYPNPPPFP